MKISFVIPAYNEEKNIIACVKSIQAAIKNCEADAEIIVVNNNSTDNTRDSVLLCGDDVILVDEERKGIVWARKAGYEASSGDLIANIDADNVMPTKWLPYVLKRFEGDDKLHALSGPLYYHDIPKHKRIAVRGFLLGGYFVNKINGIFGSASLLQGGNFILKREALEKIGGFDTSIIFYGEDTDIGHRVSKIGKVVYTFKLPIYSSGRRIEEEGLFKTGLTYAINFFTVTYRGKPTTKNYQDIRK